MSGFLKMTMYIGVGIVIIFAGIRMVAPNASDKVGHKILKQQPEKEQKLEAFLNEMQAKLKFDDKTRQIIKKMYIADMEESEDVRKDGKLTAKQREDKLIEIRKSTNEAIAFYLTPDEKQRWTEWSEELKQSRAKTAAHVSVVAKDDKSQEQKQVPDGNSQ